MPSWLKASLWTLVGVVVSCGLAIGWLKLTINSIFGRNAAQDAILAPIIIDEPINACSISPSRNFVLTWDGMNNQVYNLKTGAKIDYPEVPDLEWYKETLGWINNSTQDSVLVRPYWMFNLTTGVVSKTQELNTYQYPLWWGPLLMPDDREPYVKSPDQQYVASSGNISRPATGASPVGEELISFSNDHPTICTNAWEPDSSGYYFVDIQWRGRMEDPGPLRFLKNPER